jgi:aromatic-L-amino-acid decarboxylase
MNWNDFADWGARIANWGRDYHLSLRTRPVRAQTNPGDIAAQLDQSPPETGTDMKTIMADFDRVVMPGMTHWQHPRFFAYFPSNASPPSILADFLTSIMAAQCMLWQTSPAATEMETRVIDWLRQAIGLPEGFSGVIQDSASGATLAAVLTMRERALNWQGNTQGLSAQKPIRIYCSTEVHTSIDRAVWIAGIGGDNMRRIPVSGPLRGMDANALTKAIEEDIANGYLPAGIICCTGGTSTGSCDDITAICAVAKQFDLYTHVDAAWAGSAMICPEFRVFWQGVEQADSIVFNPHKWLGVQFDCSAHFIKDPASLVKTLAIEPEYLKTHGQSGIINYSEWSVPLGRRFRALKLWFLLRAYGLEDLRKRLRNHVTWSHALCKRLRDTQGFEILTDPVLSLFSFRHTAPTGQNIDDWNQRLVEAINSDGRIYLTQTLVKGQKAIRFQVGHFDCTKDDIDTAYDVITDIAKGLKP